MDGHVFPKRKKLRFFRFSSWKYISARLGILKGTIVCNLERYPHPRTLILRINMYTTKLTRVSRQATPLATTRLHSPFPLTRSLRRVQQEESPEVPISPCRCVAREKSLRIFGKNKVSHSRCASGTKCTQCTV